MKLIDVNSKFTKQGSDLILVKQQHITQQFLDDLKVIKNESSNKPSGEMMHVMSIPTGVIEAWMKGGFDVYKEPAKKIAQKLRAEGLDAFIVTNKNF